MAPVVPSAKRRTLRAKLAAKSGSGVYAPRKTPRPDAVETSDSFINSKKDKRLVKHSAFVSRIEKSGVQKKALKRRRPGKKLVTNMESLADALPDLLADGETEEGLQQLREGKIRHKSLKSRKGALKRKEKIVKGEVERFGVNMARLNAVPQQPTSGAMDVEASGSNPSSQGNGGAAVPATTSSRFAALRGFISATMEQNPQFLEKKPAK
ncbi:ribosome biogenesis protein SLX9-domain-containing protein [Microdochium trichocladiopsis]|uniref:Ribosome biogenesis protein SLX9 n=1 Tax=Microdochium trichocladiopsis TaxID=1682393 RepID=A0A9P8Y4T9_9PEZI|nr:ribosome biogenesis protein SLX9-domain-containing protein [Microdochium trichocladiopsis]KAH7027591.1 ribosome biogenesis protein SLX9-domain-containing protein [Microdochium trichocladiopsis]